VENSLQPAGDHYCSEKIFPKFRTYLMEAQTRRNMADYNPESLNRRKGKQQLNLATEFVHSILERLNKNDES
jgi:hypothetical protein